MHLHCNGLFSARLKRSIEKEDQITSNSIITVQYRDKSGQIKTLKGNADKLLIKRRHPNKTGGKNTTILVYIYFQFPPCWFESPWIYLPVCLG